MHYAIHGHTATEIIVERADSEKDYMGLTTWSDAPSGKIKKADVSVAKNYFSEFEMGQLERMACLKRWEKYLLRLQSFTQKRNLKNIG